MGERLTRCDNCRYFHHYTKGAQGDQSVFGWCRALPPTTDQEHKNSKGVWPLVEKKDWCGAWTADQRLTDEPVTGVDPRD
jgi:hypothetical protein